MTSDELDRALRQLRISGMAEAVPIQRNRLERRTSGRSTS